MYIVLQVLAREAAVYVNKQAGEEGGVSQVAFDWCSYSTRILLVGTRQDWRR